MRCTFLWHDSTHKFHKSILFQPATGVTVMATVPTDNYPSYHPHRRSKMQRDESKTKPGNRFSTLITTEEPLPNATPPPESSEEHDLLTNYGYSRADDALSWFYRNVLPLNKQNSPFPCFLTTRYTITFIKNKGLQTYKNAFDLT